MDVSLRSIFVGIISRIANMILMEFSETIIERFKSITDL